VAADGVTTKQTRCNWDERPAVIKWVCKFPGATVWLCRFCYGDWVHRACTAPSVLLPERVVELERGYEAFLEQVLRDNNQKWFEERGLTPPPNLLAIPQEVADLLERKYEIKTKVTA